VAYTRQTVFSSPLLTWQQVTLDEAHPQWSADFHVAATSVLLPLTHCFGCELGGQRFVCDPASALWLAPDIPYRLRRPWASQRSNLITLTTDMAAPGRAALSLTAHTSLFRWQRRLHAGTAAQLQIEEALVALLDPQQRRDRPQTLSTHAAVERAREQSPPRPNVPTHSPTLPQRPIARLSTWRASFDSARATACTPTALGCAWTWP
jgi:AraC family transcriptional regulator